MAERCCSSARILIISAHVYFIVSDQVTREISSLVNLKGFLFALHQLFLLNQLLK